MRENILWETILFGMFLFECYIVAVLVMVL